MSFIFLSHSSRDDGAAGALREWLAAEGHAAAFLDHDADGGIAGGEPWEERLYTELRRCRALVALVGPDWLASPWCVAEADHAQALRKPVLPLRIGQIDPEEYRRKAPPVLRRVQGINWDGGEEARARLRRGLLAAGLDPKDVFAWRGDRAPYPGLAAFGREDAAVYFGREQEVTDLLALLRECRAPGRPRLVLVQGASGTGKSSLLRAGVLPRLERDLDSWIVVPPFRPLRDPLAGLVDALAAVGGVLDSRPPTDPAPDPAVPAARAAWLAAWAEWIAGAAAGLRRRAGRPDATVLLSVDQLEEALAEPGGGTGGGAGDAFLLALREALAAADHRLLAVATLRADFTGTLQRHPALREPAAAGGEILATRAFQLGPLPRAAFHAVVEGPAALTGLELEPGLTSRLVEEARTDDALPLLAFVLRELWDRHGEKDLKLTHAEYDGFGGLEAAVGLRAEQIVAAVGPSAAELNAYRTTLVFGMAELSAEGRILRRRLPWAEVPGPTRRLVEEFARARLLVADEAAVEVAHEALFRRWGPLKDWIEEAKEDLGIRRRAREAAEAWNVAGRPQGSLWRSPDLDLLRRYAARNPGTLGALAAEFLGASEQQARDEERQARRRKRLAWAAVAAILLLAAGAGVFGWESQRQTRRAEAERDRAEQQTVLAKQARERAEEEGQRAEAERDRAVQGRVALLAKGAEVEVDNGDAVTGLLVALEPVVEATAGAASGMAARVDTAQAERTAYRALTQQREAMVLRGHTESVLHAAFSPDARWVATGARDRTARVWDADTGRTIVEPLRGHAGPIEAVTFSPDGRRLATASWDRTVRLWDPQTGRPIGGPLRGHTGLLSAVAFSPDGRWIATGSGDGTARLWDAETGRELAVLRGHGAVVGGVALNMVRDVAFSPEGRRLATASWDGTARLWDAETGRELATLRGHDGRVNSVAFSPDGRRLATASSDRTARLWDAETGRELAALRGHGDGVGGVAFSPDGRRLATASSDSTARLWDVDTGRELGALRGHWDELNTVAFSSDSRRLVTASSDRTARLWEMEAGRVTGAVLRGHASRARAIAFSPDGRRLATGSEDRTVRLWDVETGQELAVLRGHENGVGVVAFSPDGQHLATGSSRDIARLWDVEAHRPLGEPLRGADSLPLAVAFTPNGRRLAMSRGDHTVRLADAETGRELATLRGHRDQVYAVALSKDGRRAATASEDGTARIWDAETGRELAVVHDHKAPVRAIAFSPDGGRLATASQDRTARIWDAETGRAVGDPLRGHEDIVTTVAFSPNGRQLATGSWDGTVRVWDVTTGRATGEVRGSVGRIEAVAFSPDGRRVAVASEDGTARILPVFRSREELLAASAPRLPRCLSPSQKVSYGLLVPAEVDPEDRRQPPPPCW